MNIGRLQIINWYPDFKRIKYRDWSDSIYGGILNYSIVIGCIEFRVWLNKISKIKTKQNQH